MEYVLRPRAKMGSSFCPSSPSSLSQHHVWSLASANSGYLWRGSDGIHVDSGPITHLTTWNLEEGANYTGSLLERTGEVKVCLPHPGRDCSRGKAWVCLTVMMNFLEHGLAHTSNIDQCDWQVLPWLGKVGPRLRLSTHKEQEGNVPRCFSHYVWKNRWCWGHVSILSSEGSEMHWGVMGDEPGDAGLAGEKVFPARQRLS